MKKNLIILLLLLSLNGCGPLKIDHEFHQIKTKTQDRLQHEITYKSSDYVCDASNKYADFAQLSLDDAIAYALKNNRALQAKFEEIGIAKADLEQAGLLHNPELGAAIRYPDRGMHAENKNIEIEAMIRISDFWQVPFKKQVAAEVLEQVLLSVQSMVLDTIERTKMAYINCLYIEAQLQVSYTIHEQSVELKSTTYKRYDHGYAHDLDRYLIDALVDRSYIDRAARDAEVAQAYAQLKKVLGFAVDDERFKLTSSFVPSRPALPEFADLQSQAIALRPEMEMAERGVKQYQALVRFERSRIFEDVHFGFSYERELDGVRVWGPALSLQIPIFDPNYAQIARAKFLYEQAEKNQCDIRSTIQQEVYHPYVRLRSLYEEYTRMTESLLPSVKKGIDFAQYYTKQKRLTMPELLNTVIFFYENQQRMIDMQKMIWENQAHLERAVGATL
jgi:cobalt-zinc-cadmium efflux system outer membrane protein